MGTEPLLVPHAASYKAEEEAQLFPAQAPEAMVPEESADDQFDELMKAEK